MTTPTPSLVRGLPPRILIAALGGLAHATAADRRLVDCCLLDAMLADSHRQRARCVKSLRTATGDRLHRLLQRAIKLAVLHARLVKQRFPDTPSA